VISWKYNRFGHVEVWNSKKIEDRQADLYIQGEFDVRAFFNQQGLEVDDLEIDETGSCEDP